MVSFTCVLCGAGSWSTALSKSRKQYHSLCNFLPLTHSSRDFKEKQSVKDIMFTNQSKKNQILVSFHSKNVLPMAAAEAGYESKIVKC